MDIKYSGILHPIIAKQISWLVYRKYNNTPGNYKSLGKIFAR